MTDQAEDVFQIAIKSRVYHADLLAAAKKLGGVPAFAKYLGITESMAGNWIRLQSFPSLELTRKDGVKKQNLKLAKAWPRIAKKLFKLTGKTVQQLFPDFVRLSGVLDAPKSTTTVREVNAGMMLGYQSKEPLAIASSEESLSREEIAECLRIALKTLSYRERTVLELRFGLGEDGHTYTLDETARIFRVTKERVRQVERRAIHKLRHVNREKHLAPALVAMDFNPCPKCGHFFPSFEHCKLCNTVLCEECLREHNKTCRVVLPPLKDNRMTTKFQTGDAVEVRALGEQRWIAGKLNLASENQKSLAFAAVEGLPLSMLNRFTGEQVLLLTWLLTTTSYPHYVDVATNRIFEVRHAGQHHDDSKGPPS